MKNFLTGIRPIRPHADAPRAEREIGYKVDFLNSVFLFAGLVACGMAFLRWYTGSVLWIIDLGFAGLAFTLLEYLRRHREQIELLSSVALALSFILFFAVFLLAPGNTTRASLFFLLAASAFFLKGRKAGLAWLVLILAGIVLLAFLPGIDTAYSLLDIVTLCVYLIALYFIMNSYEIVKGDQNRNLAKLNAQLEEKIEERTLALREANQRLAQLNEELDRRVQERTEQLLQAQAELVRKESLAVLGKIAGNVGHELRNPLGVMNNAVYYLRTVLAGADETTKEYLGIIHDEIAAADRILSDLLDAVRTKPPHPEIVPVRELVDQALHACRIPPTVSVQQDIPASCPAVIVDRLQLQQVVRNLISNGIEAMPDGGGLEISARAGAEGKSVVLAVRDGGGGIAPEHQARLFQPLFSTKPRRIGLGLAVVKNLTEANHGSVTVTSEPGRGTTFSVTLPSAATPTEKAHDPESVQPETKGQ